MTAAKEPGAVSTSVQVDHTLALVDEGLADVQANSASRIAHQKRPLR
jgi:hypothetical protein